MLAQYLPGAGLLGVLVGSLILALRKTVAPVLNGKLVPLDWVDKMMVDQRKTINDQRSTITDLQAASASKDDTIAVLTRAVNELTSVGRTGVRAYQAVAAHAEAAAGPLTQTAWDAPTGLLPLVGGAP